MTTNIIGEPAAYIETLVKSGIPHRLEYTGGSCTVIIGGEKTIFSDTSLSPAELGFIGLTKKEVVLQSEKLRLPETSPIFTRIFNTFPAGNYPQMAEIDISAAFWDTAFRAELIGQRIFERGERVRKEVRLIALGAAAAQKRWFEFDGTEYVDAGTDSDKWGRRSYFYVASVVTSVLAEICNAMPGAVALYWVDAIVVRPEYAAQVKKKLFEAGYIFKEIPLENCSLKIEKGGEKVWTVTEKATGRIKNFRQFPKKNSLPEIVKNNFSGGKWENRDF